MKKIITIIFICMLMIIMTIPVVKASSTYTIELEVTKNKKDEPFELYMLLPESYITHVIHKVGLDIEYIGPETLIQNEINKCVTLCANCHREFHYLEKAQGLTIEEYLGD